eukprot:CAMPEP_0172925928 /NCGR_PEP_ID=MMETSP1075-20121228/214637_1 /TAXON_ID=2916 /ORGANISM="Ceratium fusus, Strain PA161109" /LENGTH=30 /DNA_ID= /DNA_START= /DNA_END= /DNA_ORIENTATION=
MQPQASTAQQWLTQPIMCALLKAGHNDHQA